MSSLIEFGPSARANWFCLEAGTIFANHGSYGAAPKKILAKKRQLQDEMDRNPDKWFRYTSFELWTRNINSLAEYFKTRAENMLICENATEAINSILKSVEFNLEQPTTECILATQYTYQAVLNTIDYTSRYRLGGQNIQVVKLKITFPIRSVQELLDELDSTCAHIINERKLNLKLAVIDHIASATGIYFPVKEMNQVIRKWAKQCLILIDGAHAPGQVPIDFESIDCDFYVGNLHKWFQAPRGCSLLYFRDKERLANNLQPSYISHGYNMDLSYNFYQRGTADKTSWFVVDECVEFYEEYLGGMDRIHEYTSQILDRAVQLLVEGWKTDILRIPKEIEAPFLRGIKLPYLKEYQCGEDRNAESVCYQLMRDIFERFRVICCVVYLQEELYCRISCYVYNCLHDYEVLRDAVLSLI
jgi:selenocysteine lyase/cysteine desulfurase